MGKSHGEEKAACETTSYLEPMTFLSEGKFCADTSFTELTPLYAGHQNPWHKLVPPLIWSTGGSQSDPLKVITGATESAAHRSPITQKLTCRTPGEPLLTRSWYCQDFGVLRKVGIITLLI